MHNLTPDDVLLCHVQTSGAWHDMSTTPETQRMDQITGCGSDSIESCNFGDTDAAAGVVAESLHLLIDDPLLAVTSLYFEDFWDKSAYPVFGWSRSEAALCPSLFFFLLFFFRKSPLISHNNDTAAVIMGCRQITRGGFAWIRYSSQIWASINHVIPVLGSWKQHSDLRDYPSLASSPTAACSKLRSQSDPAYHLFPGLLRPRAHLLYCTMRPLYSQPFTRVGLTRDLIAMHLPWRLHSYGLPRVFSGLFLGMETAARAICSDGM